MKIFLLDEVYDFAKRIGIIDKINELAKSKYNASTIQSDLQSYYDITNSEEYKAIIDELETKLKEEDLSLYNLQAYAKSQSYDVINALLNSVKNIRDRFLLIDKAIAYKMGSTYEYEILISLFCAMYDEVAENIRESLPKYIHVAYFNYNSIKFCLNNLSTSGGLDLFDEYEKFMDNVYKKINGYINSDDTLSNLRLEVRCAALQYILPRMDNDKKLETLGKIEKLADVSKMTFDNRYNSIGVIWTFERLYESYLDLGNYTKFFEWVYKQYMYIDNALSNKELLFDALRYYNKNNITGFIISMKRFYKIQNLYPIFNMEFQNVSQSDEDFITNPDLDYTLYDDYSNKLIMEKFKNYVDAWYENNKNKLEDLANNREVLYNCKRVVIDGISEEELNNMNSISNEYNDHDHPENNTEVMGGTFIDDDEVVEEEPTTPPNIELTELPPGFDFNLSDLENLNNLENTQPDNKSVEDLINLEASRSTEENITDIPQLPNNISIPTEIPIPTEEEPVGDIEEPETLDNMIHTELEEEEEAPVSIPEVPTNIDASALPPLPSGFTVNADELSSLTEEELAAMNEME